jgi:hypothetical protein
MLTSYLYGLNVCIYSYVNGSIDFCYLNYDSGYKPLIFVTFSGLD